MPITYRIDADLGVVLTVATGVLTDDELLAHKRALMRDPGFKAGMVELSDVRAVERLEVTSEGVGRFVAQDQADAARLTDYKLAIVASREVVFGMARMYQMLTEAHVPSVRIFRDLDQAQTWLDLGSRGS